MICPAGISDHHDPSPPLGGDRFDRCGQRRRRLVRSADPEFALGPLDFRRQDPPVDARRLARDSDDALVVENGDGAGGACGGRQARLGGVQRRVSPALESFTGGEQAAAQGRALGVHPRRQRFGPAGQGCVLRGLSLGLAADPNDRDGRVDRQQQQGRQDRDADEALMGDKLRTRRRGAQVAWPNSGRVFAPAFGQSPAAPLRADSP
jgi:hypothetical protein